MFWLGGLVSLCALACPGVAQALSLNLVTTDNEVKPGEAFQVDLQISDLGQLAAPSLGAFDINLEFDATALTLKDIILGDQLNLGGFGILSGSTPTATGVNVFVNSLDFPGVLDSTQADRFTLATFSFIPQQAGLVNFDLAVNDLGDSLGNPLFPTTLDGTSVLIAGAPPPTPVPEPGLPIFLGAIALVARRVHQRRLMN